MLSLLHIENIALIQSADIRFEPGFNVLTGETGAGKSIVIDSIGAVLGERTSRELIRTGAKSALVTAVFTQVPPLPWLEENGLRTAFLPGRRSSSSSGSSRGTAGTCAASTESW